MYNRTDTRSGFIPLIIGGVIGYGIGNNNKNNYPMYPIPVYPVSLYPYRPPYYQTNYYYPPYRNR